MSLGTTHPRLVVCELERNENGIGYNMRMEKVELKNGHGFVFSLRKTQHKTKIGMDLLEYFPPL